MATYTGPNGWTADSVVGAINAASQAPITADDLLTSTGKANDSALESRAYLNPYTGVRDPAITGSVYAQGNVPAWLSGEVAALNAEQALRRSAQAEIFNKIYGEAQGGGPNSLPWMEVLRAAVLQPGVEAGFGSSVVDPNIGLAARDDAQANMTAAGAYANTLNDAVGQRRAALEAANRTNTVFNTGWSVNPRPNPVQNTSLASRSADSVARAVLGTNPFTASRGYIGGSGFGMGSTGAAPAGTVRTGGNATIDSGGTGGFASSRLNNPYWLEHQQRLGSQGVSTAVRAPATNQAYAWGDGYVGPTQFSVDNPAYNTYAGSNFLVR